MCNIVLRDRRGTSWHSHLCDKAPKALCVGGAILSNTFEWFLEGDLLFSWPVQHFGDLHVHFSWQAQRFRPVVLRVFCKSHWQGCLKHWQSANCLAGVVHHENVILGGRRSIGLSGVVRGMLIFFCGHNIWDAFEFAIDAFRFDTAAWGAMRLKPTV